MTDVPTIPRPSQLWKQLSPERKLQAADAFWRDENAAVEQAEAVAAIAQRIKFRAKSVIGLPVGEEGQAPAALPGVSELVAARLLVAYHLAHQRPMMAASSTRSASRTRTASSPTRTCRRRRRKR